MSFSSKYAELRLKRLLEKETDLYSKKNTQPTKFEKEYAEKRANRIAQDIEEDIAPVVTKKTSGQEAVSRARAKRESLGEEERTWFQKGAFDDGYDFGDVTKSILGTVADVGENVGAGIIGMGEKAVDATVGLGSLLTSVGNGKYGSHINPKTGKRFNPVKEQTINSMNEFVAKDLYDEERVAKAILSNPLKAITGVDTDKDSLLGEKTDSLAQSGGQLLGTVGLQAVGVPWFLTTGVTSYGSEVEGALNQGASIEEASLSAAITAGAEILTEKISGGISFGGKTLDDALTKKIARGVSNKTVRSLAKLGVDMAGEGAEEVLSGAMSAIGQKITYADDKELTELFSSEDALESFIGGAVLGGIGNRANIVKSKKAGVDSVTGLTKNEQSVVDKVYKDRLAEAEENGKLKEKDKSRIYDDVLNDLDKGYISTDTIESILGGETYKSYKDTIDSEDALKQELDELRKMKNGDRNDIQNDRLAELKAMNLDDTSKRDSLKTQLGDEVFSLVKNDRLAESYNERSRRGQYFEADLSKYDKKYQDTIKKAIESKTLNNTNRTHELVDMIAKISADKGVSFDFTNNAKLKESGFALDGRTINGFVTKDGITLNTDSAKYLRSVVGHEVSHVLEGTELYKELQNTLIEYAKTKNDYQGRIDSLTELYKGVEGADINAELTADLVGDYLFTDNDFVSKLSTEHRNVFQKLYDEIKYLYKVATAGSKEARELEKVKRAFDKAYKESGKLTDTKYSLTEYTPEEKQAHNEAVLKHFGKTFNWNETGYLLLDGTRLDLSGKHDGAPGGYRTVDHRDISDALGSEYGGEDYSGSLVQFMSEGNIRIVPEIGGINLSVQPTKAQEQALSAYISRNRGEIVLDIDDNNGNTVVSVEYPKGTQSGKVLNDISMWFEKGIEPEVSNHSQFRFSLSAKDTDGKQLTSEQQRYFKNSKVRDDNGNLKVMYHGSENAGFHEFDGRFSDDDISFFFVDRNDVAASYSGTTETYEAQTIRTAEDMNKFIESIDAEGYEVVEKDGKFILLYEGDRVADSKTAQGIYDEFCWYEGVGEGDANYKVYLNLKNPLIVDAKGRPWNKIDAEFSQEVYDKYQSLTAEEKAALIDLAEWEDFRIFNSEIQEAKDNELASAYKKMGEDVNIYDLFSVASDNFSEESLRENSRNYLKTRDYAQRAKEQGYDGVIINNVVDNGGYSNGDEGASNVAIAFSSEQIKSVANTKPTTAADIRYSLSADSNGNELSPAVQKRFAKSKVVDENGNLKVLYHGTATGEFSIFDKAKGNVEGDYGSGFYFTDNEADVTEHYEGGGPDFDNKVTRRGEEIYNEALDNGNEISYDEAERRAREELYKGSHKFEVYLNIENPAIVGETNLLSQDKYLEEYNEEDYESYDDYIDDVEQLVADDIEGIVWEIEKNVDVDRTDGIANILYEAYYDGGIDTEQLKAKINDLYLEDSNGNLVANEVTRQIIESLGYDGIIDPTVAGKWNMDIEPGTTHYIAFKPNQIKAITNQSPTDNPNIHYSLSWNGEQPKKVGKLHESGEDVAYRGKDIAPIKKTLSDNVFPDDFAPMTEQEAADLQRESLAHIDDADAPPEKNTEYYEIPDTTSLDGEAETKLVNILRDTLGLDAEDKKRMQEIVRKYSKGEYPSEAELFEDVSDNFRELTWTTKNDLAIEVKNYLRKTRVKVSDTIKGDIPNYNDFRKKNCWGRIRVNNEGTPVDSLYMELTELYPSYFPEDIINPTEQFLQMVDVANSSSEIIDGYRLEDSELQSVVNIITSEVGKYKENEVMKAAEEDRQAFMKEVAQYDAEIETTDGKTLKPEKVRKVSQIQTVEERLQHKLNHSYGELSHNKRLMREAIADYNNKIEKLELEYDSKKNKLTKSANDILRRIERLKRLRDDVEADYSKRINDNRTKVEKYKALLEEGYSEEEGRMMRTELHAKKIEDIKNKFSENGLNFDETLRSAKNLSTFATVDNTPQRVMEKALGYKNGQVLADLTVNKVAQNETEGIKWLNSVTSRQGKGGLLQQLSDKYHIKSGSKESAAAQMYAEGFYVNDKGDIIQYGDAELAKDFPNAKVRENIKGLATDTRIRQFYDDTLAKINESRTRNAYPKIKPLKNYFLHFRAMEDTFSRMGIPFNPNDIKAKDLPTDLNGVTADLKPGQPYFASAMHRKGNKTTYDILGGIERYASGAKNQIYHIDDIQTFRALRNYIADTYGQANGLENLDTLAEEEVQERIKQVYGSHLSTFAKFLNEEANVIAGKTALIDRGLEGIIGRRGITFLDTVNKQVGSNMVGYNISSSLTNFIPVAQTFAKTNKYDFVKAFAQTTANKVGSIFGSGDGFAEHNPTMIRRKGAERFHRTTYQQVSDAGYALLGAVDNISTELIVRTKYNELTRKGMSNQEAIVEADKWASRLMGDRSLGQQPQLYNSKMLGLITKFQLEVRNQLDSQFYDTIQETMASNEQIKSGIARNAKTAAKVTSTFVQLAIAQHLFGKAFESVTGYNPAFDIIGVIMTAFGFDDDEESEDTALDNVEQAFLELLEDLPYTSTFTGGRIPISSALPITELVKGEDEYGNKKARLETLGEIAPYYVLPGGYGQLKKTAKGLSMFREDHPIAGSYTDSGSLRFPIEDTLENKIQSGLFGQWANENARYYLDNELAPLKEKQIQEFIDVDMPIKDYWDYREGLSKYQTLAEKAEYINSLDLSVEQKNTLINNIADRKEDIDMSEYDNYDNFEEFDFAEKNPEKYEFLQSNNISYAEYSASDESKELYNWAYRNPERITMSKAVGGLESFKNYSDELYDIKADKDENGKSISGSRKEKVIEYINNLDADYGEKIILFKSEYNADDTYNYEIIDYLNSRDDISYKEMETILKELGFNVSSDGTVSWD